MRKNLPLAALALVAIGPGCWILWTLQLSRLAAFTACTAWIALVTWLIVRLIRAQDAPLRSLASVISAFREGDYAIRTRRVDARDQLGLLTNEINELGSTLHAQRLRAIEASALLDDLIRSIDVAVLVFDADRKLTLFNPAASRLVQVLDAAGCTAAALGLSHFIADDFRSGTTMMLGDRTGRWQVTHGSFREGGRAQHLLIVTDVSQALREEERDAWQRLVRVIGHEVNNSLTPIKSLAESLQDMTCELPMENSARAQVLDALRMIAERSDSLARFLARYGQLARLPPLRRRWQPLASLLHRVNALHQPRVIGIDSPTELQVFVDEDQMEQVLINLVKNALEAQADLPGTVNIVARAQRGELVIAVTDDGPGVANADNLFVPLFTTKAGGSGIGLVLSRKITEAHGGTLQLENRGQRGAVATLRVPEAAR